MSRLRWVPGAQGRGVWSVMLGVALMLVGCTSSVPPQPPAAAGPSAPGQVKTVNLTLGTNREPPSPALFGASGGGSSALEPFYMFHASLTVYDPTGAVTPVLAQKVPSIQDGDWKVNPDGTMVVTWKLKPNLTWHDGQPLTADDFVFGYQLNTDPDLPLTPVPGALQNITSVMGPDPQTIVATWKVTSAAGGISAYDGIPAAPRHLLGDLYAAGKKDAVNNSAYWTTSFVGVGPYKLTQWIGGSLMEGVAFDGYAGGRPKIDRAVLKMIGDANGMVASMLAGDIDIIPLGAEIGPQPVAVVRDAWGPTNAGTTGSVPKAVRTLYLQLRDPSVPWADLRVRQALLTALDRQAMVETLEVNTTQQADFFAPVGDPVLELAQSRGLPTFKFEPARAAQLMSQAGWTKGGDGKFRNAAGQNVQLSVATSNDGTNAQEAAIIASQLSDAGFAADPAPYVQTNANRLQLAANFSSMLVKPWNFTVDAPGNLRQSQIGTQQKAWAGNNYGGYVNPSYDDIYRAYVNDLEPSKRTEDLFQIVQLIDQQLPVLPMFYLPQIYAFRKGLTGPGQTAYMQAASAWNIATWDINRP